MCRWVINIKRQANPIMRCKPGGLDWPNFPVIQHFREELPTRDEELGTTVVLCRARHDGQHAPSRSTETFSKSFSKGVRNGSSLQRPSYLILFGKSRNFDLKNWHEPPDSDLRLQI